MAKRGSGNSRAVYSTEFGRLCPGCQQPVDQCACKNQSTAPEGDGVVRIRRETKGRGGKAVSVVSGIPLAGAELKALAKKLKQKCGVGGAVKGDDIEIQGDQREVLKAELEKQGYIVKFSGG